ncbi:MAG: hypothetical protein K9L68_13540 [Spirochaetales bacterium]|nr:hypothetical protein [Spirochaetales bacterium]MCF7939615.1 hypothetical protein [Spirochaetales bacterium]
MSLVFIFDYKISIHAEPSVIADAAVEFIGKTDGVALIYPYLVREVIEPSII